MLQRIWWKELAIAGVAGCTCSYVYKHVKAHPRVSPSVISPRVSPILQGSLAAGLVGTGIGLAAASYRNLSPLSLHAASVGINFTIATAAFLGIREGVVYVCKGAFNENQTTPGGRYDYLTSCVSGGITGTLLSVSSRLGLKSVLSYSIGGAVVGVTGQCLYLWFETWRQKRAIKLYYPELAPPMSRQWTLDRIFRFMNKTSKLATASRQLYELERLVEIERARIAELDRLLTASSNNDLHNEMNDG